MTKPTIIDMRASLPGMPLLHGGMPIADAALTASPIAAMPASTSSTAHLSQQVDAYLAGSASSEGAAAGIGRRGFLAVASATMLSATLPQLTACAKKRFVPDKYLRRDMSMLDGYLKRQNVADASDVEAFYITEYAQHKVTELNLCWIPDQEHTFRVARRTAMVLRNITVDPTISSTGEKVGAQFNMGEVVILIPQQSVRWINGTNEERNTFDSVFYHEVAGHVHQFDSGSPFAILFNGLVELIRADTKEHIEDMDKAGLLDAREAQAFIMEVDRLITKFKYLSNRNVVTGDRQYIIDRALLKHFRVLLDSAKPGKSGPKGLRIVEGAFREFIVSITKKVSEDTRAYVKNLLITHGWTEQLPF